MSAPARADLARAVLALEELAGMVAYDLRLADDADRLAFASEVAGVLDRLGAAVRAESEALRGYTERLLDALLRLRGNGTR